MAGKITEESFNKQKVFLMLMNLGALLYILFFYPQGFSFWGFKGVNVYASVFILPIIFRIYVWDFWAQNKLEVEQKLFYYWLTTIVLSVCIVLLSPFFHFFAKSLKVI